MHDSIEIPDQAQSQIAKHEKRADPSKWQSLSLTYADENDSNKVKMIEANLLLSGSAMWSDAEKRALESIMSVLHLALFHKGADSTMKRKEIGTTEEVFNSTFPRLAQPAIETVYFGPGGLCPCSRHHHF